jgi:alpha-1,6-mannosyltransferase
LTSLRARWSLAILVAGYFAIAVVAGAPNSPLTVLLPEGARPPSWSSTLARVAGLDAIGRRGLTGIAWILVLVVLAAFVLVLAEAWSGRIGLSVVLVASGLSLAISVAAPLLLSHDVMTYAAYGRVEALYRHNPYVSKLSSFPHDPFVAATPGQWVHTHSVYGPLFTLASAGIARAWAGSADATILAFKLLSGLAIAAATGLTAFAAARMRPGRAPFAAALVGLNPVLVIHTVGGGHVDALIACPLAGAMAIAVTRPPPASARATAVTLLLTVAFLVKAVMVPVLALWLWWLARGRKHILVAHLSAVAGLTLASISPYVAGWHTFAPFATLGGVEAWASPSHLIGSAAQAVAGGGAAIAVEAAFLLFFVALAWRVGRTAAPPEAWGVALLLLALSMPFLLPWYAAWFAPFLALFADEVLLLAGALVTAVLALTLIPADPLHGLTSPAVMDGVHYGAAPVLLVVLAVAASRVLGAPNQKAGPRRVQRGGERDPGTTGDLSHREGNTPSPWPQASSVAVAGPTPPGS